MTLVRKTLTASLAAIALGATLITTASDASARGGFHGGHGFRGHGGIHHGGHWGGRHWGRHWGPRVGIGLGAVALGSAVAYGGDCYIARRAVTNRFGDVVGFRRVRVCG